MFGYLTADVGIMNKEQKKLYRSYYCGLCKELGDSYGNTGRKTLTYDLTFVLMLLSDVYQSKTDSIQKLCPLHPLRKIQMNITEFSKYAADMNILLTYYKCVDDINDEQSSSAKRRSVSLETIVKTIQLKYPEKCKLIQEMLDQINQMELHNELNPDLPAKAFGTIMAELFHVNDDEYTTALMGFGFNLGRFIYMIDAICDLKQDIKNQHYNPLISLESFNAEEALQLIMEDADYFYNQLPLEKLKEITDNVVYSGLWSKFDLHQRKLAKEKKK